MSPSVSSPGELPGDKNTNEPIIEQAAQPHNESWRRELDGLLAHTTQQPSRIASSYTPLGIQYELREIVPRSRAAWNAPLSKTARASEPGAGLDPALDYQLGIRPTLRTAKGWAKGSLTWSKLPHLIHRNNLDPAQQKWFTQLYALYRAHFVATGSYEADWVYLDDFANPVLWHLLRQADELGIASVGSAASARIQHSQQAQLVMDARLHSPDEANPGGLTLAHTLLLDGVSTPLGSVRAIGDHGIYLVGALAPQRVTIAPLREPLTAEQRAMLRAGQGARTTIDIPARAVEGFRVKDLPALQRQYEVTSSDGSLMIPAASAPKLVLTLSFGSRHSLALAWRWQHAPASATAPDLAEVIPAGILPAEWMANTSGDVSRAAWPLPIEVELRGIDAAEFAAVVVPQLEALPEVVVERIGKQPRYRELTGIPELTISSVPAEKHDWFELAIVITLDGQNIPFVPLFKALATGKKKLLLIDGSYVALSKPEFIPLRELINESKDLIEWRATPIISKHQTALWSAFEDVAEESTPAIEWRALLDEVRGAAPETVPVPAALRATLRDYQQQGLDWLAFLWRHRLGGILADDMGLGKTLQTLALITHAREVNPEKSAPFLVVAPTSVVSNWASEAARFAPSLDVRVVSATEAASPSALAEQCAGADVVITSYALFRLDFEAYQTLAETMGWAGLILDEAQFVKNHAARVHECAVELTTDFKLAVTGTPIENSLIELHALFAVVAPGLFASARRFSEEFVRPIEKIAPGITHGRGAGRAPEVAAETKEVRLERLRRRIRPFMLRRTKELVAPELPAKQEQTLSVPLAPEHRALYELFLQRERQKLFGLLEEFENNRFVIFRSLTLLRLLALDASLIDSDEYDGVPSSKLDALFEQLDDVIAEGHRSLVFSQFTSYLAIAANRLERAGIPYVYLDGSTRKRAEVIASFKTGTAPVFLISLKAGGFGLNLTEADYVFLLDPWWNPATEAQAIDRTHRIGQDKNVFVYRLIAEDTIEQRVMALKERKAALFDAVIDDEELFARTLSADDIRGLLA